MQFTRRNVSPGATEICPGHLLSFELDQLLLFQDVSREDQEDDWRNHECSSLVTYEVSDERKPYACYVKAAVALTKLSYKKKKKTRCLLQA